MNQRLLVIGGGVAAIRTIEAAREAGYAGQITLVGDEAHLPYERPPLSKQVLSGTWDARTVFPRSDEELANLNVEFILNRRAERLDTAQQVVFLNDNSEIRYDRLVIATGARARPLPFAMPKGVHLLRKLEDSLAVSEQLQHKPRVAIVGAGFVGLEVAATAHGMGCDVTLIESGRVPLVRALGPVMGSNCAVLHEGFGVRVRTHGRVLGFTSQEHVTGVILEDEIIPAELVVVGIGALPNQEWLEGSGLELGNGILCDSNGKATPDGTVFAIGDVASWWNTDQRAHVRQEHWTSAVEQAKHVGRIIAGIDTPEYRYTPYFWSDQHGIKIQMIGTAAPEDELHVLLGSAVSGRFLAVYSSGETVTAILSFDATRELARFRVLFNKGATLDAFIGLGARLQAQSHDVAAV